MPATREGFILGTPPYMSPEQARGQQVDKRSDIWSYGCVLYEMLTGRCAFSGETASDTIAAILTATPNWDLLPASTSPELRRLLGRCLEKDRTQRLRDIGEARVELDVIERAAGGSAPASSAADRRPAVGPNESVAVVAVNDTVDLDYLSDGIAEALTYRLTAIPGLRVAPWAMVLRIRAKASGLRDHGQGVGGPDVVDCAAHDTRGHPSHPCRMVRSDRDDALVGRSILQTHR